MLDIEAILSQMTLEEKATFCTGATPWSTLAIERLGVPSIVMTDGPHGVRRASDPRTLSAKSLPATCFPTASCTASTWNPALLQRMGEAMAPRCCRPWSKCGWRSRLRCRTWSWRRKPLP